MELLNGGKKVVPKDDTLLKAHGAGAGVHAFKLNKRRMKCSCGCNVFIPEMTGIVVVDVTEVGAPPEVLPHGSRFRCLDCRKLAAYSQADGRWYMYDESLPENQDKQFMELERL